MSVEVANGEVCPLSRGNDGIELCNVVDGGGAADGEVSNLTKIQANFSMTQGHNVRGAINGE